MLFPDEVLSHVREEEKSSREECAETCLASTNRNSSYEQ